MLPKINPGNLDIIKFYWKNNSCLLLGSFNIRSLSDAILVSTKLHLYSKQIPKSRLVGALGGLGRVLGRLGVILGRLGMVLESSWDVFGRLVGLLGLLVDILDRLVDVLGRLGKKLLLTVAGTLGPPIRILYDFPDIIGI